MGFTHDPSSPKHAKSNGMAESAVKTVNPIRPGLFSRSPGPGGGGGLRGPDAKNQS